MSIRFLRGPFRIVNAAAVLAISCAAFSAFGATDAVIPSDASHAAGTAGPNTGGNDGPAYGPELEGFDYPYPVRQYPFESQGVPLHMAYLDVAPAATPNGRAAVLLHGKNFCAATWEGTIKTLSSAGYRVIAPDQIGFCKSSK